MFTFPPDFWDTLIIKSNYYRLNLNLLNSKQGSNQTNANIFQISIKTSACVDLYISLKIDNIEYSYQHDITQINIINCFLTPPSGGLYKIIIYAKTNNEITYQDTIYMRLNVSNLIQPIAFSIIYPSFIEYKYILSEPFQRLVQEHEYIYIHMKKKEVSSYMCSMK